MKNLQKLIGRTSGKISAIKNLIRKISSQTLAITYMVTNVTMLCTIKANSNHSSLSTSQTQSKINDSKDNSKNNDPKPLPKSNTLRTYGTTAAAGASLLATLAYGANYLYQHRGWTQLHYDAANGNITTFKNLKNEDFDELYIVDNNNHTPLDVALRNKHPEILTAIPQCIFSDKSMSHDQKSATFKELFSLSLARAIWEKNIDVIETLLTDETLKSYVGSYINCTITGTVDSVLDIAIEKEIDPSVIGLLIHHGASCKHNILSLSERNEYEKQRIVKYSDCNI